MSCVQPNQPEDMALALTRHPWTMAVPPFQVAPRVWYVSGQRWVGCYLIDTGAGLVLLDTALAESLYLLIDAIYRIGYRPEDIRKILISHGHFDHCGAAGALKALSGAELYLSREDWAWIQAYPEETIAMVPGIHAQAFQPDHFYADNRPVALGDVTFHTRLTPGHTPGCTSFFWEMVDRAAGERYRIAMHGGVGTNTMNDEYYAHSRSLTPALRARFLRDAEAMRTIPVDIALPSHPNQRADFLDKAGSYADGYQPYLDRTAWTRFLEERIRLTRATMGERE